MRKTIILLTFVAVAGIGSYLVFAQDPMGGGMMGGGMMGGQQSTWQVPSTAANQKNPVPADSDSVAAGRKLFDSYCASCHGMNAKGNNGVAADLTAPAVQNQTGGVLFWKVSQGRSPMPSFANILTAHQRWNIINYIRTLDSESAQNQTETIQPGMSGGMQQRGITHGGSLAASPDGGVIILVGNELLKYDKELNLINRVEIKFNWENW